MSEHEAARRRFPGFKWYPPDDDDDQQPERQPMHMQVSAEIYRDTGINPFFSSSRVKVELTGEANYVLDVLRELVAKATLQHEKANENP